MRPSTWGLDSTHRNGGLREGGAARLEGPHVVDARAHQGLHRNHPDPFRARPLDGSPDLGLERHEVELGAQLLVEARVLREVVGDEDDVGEIVVERVVEALDEGASMAGHPAKTDLAVADRPVGELRPFGVLQPPHVVDGMVEVDVHVVGTEPPQRAFERGHHLAPRLAAPRLVLRREDVAIAFTLQRFADRFLGPAAAIALGGIEVGDAAARGVANERRIGRSAGPERDVGDSETGIAQSDMPLNARRPGPGPHRDRARRDPPSVRPPSRETAAGPSLPLHPADRAP